LKTIKINCFSFRFSDVVSDLFWLTIHLAEKSFWRFVGLKLLHLIDSLVSGALLEWLEQQAVAAAFVDQTRTVFDDLTQAVGL
jgi:hypothetical protein